MSQSGADSGLKQREIKPCAVCKKGVAHDNQIASSNPSCIGGDPLCPCADGDACHYKDTPTTKAWPIPSSQQASFYRLKPEHNGREYPWPCEREPSRVLQIFADDVLTKAPPDSPYSPGKMTKHTGLGCWGIEIPDEHMDAYTGWPRMSMNGHQYGAYEEPKLVSQQSTGEKA